MYKVYFNKNDFYNENKIDLEIDLVDGFEKNNYILKFYDNNNQLYVLSDKLGDCYLIGDLSLVKQASDIFIKYKLGFNKIVGKNKLIALFADELIKTYKGEYELHDGYLIYKSEYEVMMVAGGCFWCMAKPYNEYEGVISVKSGYAGGNVYDPSYKEVKSQTTGHKEVVKIIYDPKVITFKELLTIYFESIDPFDDGGQFIDRGESYTTAVFTDEDEKRQIFTSLVNKIEEKYNQSVKVKLLNDVVFYEAEDYHQDYAIKNEEAFKEEEHLSKRDVFDYIKLD